MPENIETKNATTTETKKVTAADVDWIDHYGAALIHGHRFTPGDVATFEYRHDRDSTGRLRVQAKERIARILTMELATHANLWRRARDAYRAERLSEGATAPDTFQGPADTGVTTIHESARQQFDEPDD